MIRNWKGWSKLSFESSRGKKQGFIGLIAWYLREESKDRVQIKRNRKGWSSKLRVEDSKWRFDCLMKCFDEVKGNFAKRSW